MREENTTRFEEALNSATHGLGLLLSLVGLPVLIALSVMRGTTWHILGCTVFGISLVFLYTASTLYHSFNSPRAKEVLRILDHSAIYLLIAGTYTPFTLVRLRGHWGWTLFGLVWGLTLFGIVFKLFHANRFEVLSTLLYIAMGWLAIFAIKPMLTYVPLGAILWLLAGGLFYTTGTLFFAWNKIPYNHAIWHLFVLAGSICHFIAVLLYIVPPQNAN